MKPLDSPDWLIPVPRWRCLLPPNYFLIGFARAKHLFAPLGLLPSTSFHILS
jgi:hypothetical protein